MYNVRFKKEIFVMLYWFLNFDINYNNTIFFVFMQAMILRIN